VLEAVCVSFFVKSKQKKRSKTKMTLLLLITYALAAVLAIVAIPFVYIIGKLIVQYIILQRRYSKVPGHCQLIPPALARFIPEFLYPGALRTHRNNHKNG